LLPGTRVASHQTTYEDFLVKDALLQELSGLFRLVIVTDFTIFTSFMAAKLEFYTFTSIKMVNYLLLWSKIVKNQYKSIKHRPLLQSFGALTFCRLSWHAPESAIRLCQSNKCCGSKTDPVQ
jgi:hypothetical protein